MSLEPSNKKRRIEESESHTFSFKSTNYQISDIPFIILSYVRAFLHILGIIVILIVLISLVRICLEEIESQYQLEVTEIEEKVKNCNHNYISNNCGPNLQGLVWQQFCHEWDVCRRANMQNVGRAKIVTRVFGELVDTLIEPLTLKSMMFILFSVFGFFIISSFISL
ncbi:Di-sulfide bridge nucleocytoplasmic transport domain-containing protein [Sporodiniella umbellata]|nr:Di-sulfide bridge nucleocytoplasmic transport domain-containing protein [Sporodiniella umbellata]